MTIDLSFPSRNWGKINDTSARFQVSMGNYSFVCPSPGSSKCEILQIIIPITREKEALLWPITILLNGSRGLSLETSPSVRVWAQYKHSREKMPLVFWLYFRGKFQGLTRPASTTMFRFCLGLWKHAYHYHQETVIISSFCPHVECTLWNGTGRNTTNAKRKRKD